MNLRGKRALAPERTISLNVTSAQQHNKNRRDFSPMTESNFRGYYNFEAYWQSGKVFEGISEAVTKKFWKNITEPKRRYPGSKGKRVLYAQWIDNSVKEMDYITSRKKVYVPLYYEMMKDTEMALYWKKRVDEGENIVIYDFDGPRLSDGDVTCIQVNEKILQQKINDTRFPFDGISNANCGVASLGNAINSPQC